MHVQLVSHQPHAESPVHAPQSPWASHGSVTTQALGTHRQAVHVPDVGPLPEPLWHIQSSSHQPQPACVVHLSQLHQSLQGSTVEQDVEYHTQSGHEPPDGPL
jgi:hypothetical protein